MSDLLATTPLSAIRVFEAAARLKSFTRAAQELNITQAAVSWQVKALEQRLGQSLFLRLPREVSLTPGGERLSRAASEALSLIRTALADISETGEGVLAITTLQSLASQWLAPRLGGFQIAHPKIAVRLETASRLVDLARENIDAAIRGGGGEWPGMESHYLFASVATPLCTPEVAATLTCPEDLLIAPRIGTPDEWSAWFAQAGVSDEDGAAPLRMSSDMQVIEVASALAGHGAALGSPILYAPEIAAGRLVQPFETVIPFGRGFWLVYPAERRRSPKIAAFRAWISDLVAADPVIARFAALA